ncbi:hypothetical protein HBB16_04015 [Pseudonocardia sp. MCCB 268]|nr:hypothetical protein [Pseudonocardia cytotoxica]
MTVASGVGGLLVPLTGGQRQRRGSHDRDLLGPQAGPDPAPGTPRASSTACCSIAFGVLAGVAVMRSRRC